MNNKIILDLCGGTGAWSKPYLDAGYDVRVITFPKYDVRKVIFHTSYMVFLDIRDGLIFKKNIVVKYEDVYGILAAPPCTQFSKAAWNIKKLERDFVKGMEKVRACLDIIWTIQEHGAPLKFWALENPMGYLYNFLGFPVYYFQPWWFGETGFTATKRTALWGYFKKPIRIVKTRTIPFINSYSQAKNQLPENKKWYSASSKERSITPPGFAKAFYEANK